jgi:hypothetical protein
VDDSPQICRESSTIKPVADAAHEAHEEEEEEEEERLWWLWTREPSLRVLLEATPRGVVCLPDADPH